jgi:hypothetical protein
MKPIIVKKVQSKKKVSKKKKIKTIDGDKAKIYNINTKHSHSMDVSRNSHHETSFNYTF